jgi:K(+)-stimulated pyrophosphate-energized sodium pump
MMAYLENNPDTKVIISGFHDATEDLAKNQSLSKKRAQSVYDVLITTISAERIKLRKPVSTDGGEELMEARRVEVSVE